MGAPNEPKIMNLYTKIIINALASNYSNRHFRDSNTVCPRNSGQKFLYAIALVLHPTITPNGAGGGTMRVDKHSV